MLADGQVLFYQPSHLLRLYQDNPKYLNPVVSAHHIPLRIPAFVVKGRREPQLGLACDIAVENVIDSLNRTASKRPLTYVRQNAYQQITAEETVVAAARSVSVAPPGRHLVCCASWSQEFVTTTTVCGEGCA